MIVETSLLISAVRAFLGHIHPEMRAIQVKSEGDLIIVVVVLDREPTEQVREDILDATTEIIADFPSPTNLKEQFVVSTMPLTRMDSLEGWIYQRAE